MRALIVVAYDLFPLNTGGRIATADFLRSLLSLGLDISVIVLRSDTGAFDGMVSWENHSFHLNQIPDLKQSTVRLKHLDEIRRYLLQQFDGLIYTKERQIVLALEHALKIGNYNVIICENFSSAEYLEELRKAECPIFYRAHNLESELSLRELTSGDFSLSGLWLYFKRRRYEKSIVKKFDAIAAISPNVQKKLRRLAGVNAVVVPPGLGLIPVRRMRPVTSEKKSSSRLLFVGDLRWPPNVVAVRWFLTRVLHKIKAKRFEVKIITRTRPKDLVCPKNVSFIETEDLTGFYKDSDIVLLPIRSGSGLRLKVLEAAKAGKAVVSTSIAVESLGLENGRHLLLADTASSFAAAVDRLIQQPQYARVLAKNLQRRAVDEFSESKVRSGLERLLNRRESLGRWKDSVQ